MSAPVDRPRSGARDAWALLVLLLWPFSFFWALAGGFLQSSWTGQPVSTQDAWIGGAMLWSGGTVVLLGPFLSLWLARVRLLQVLALVEIVMLPGVLMSVLS